MTVHTDHLRFGILEFSVEYGMGLEKKKTCVEFAGQRKAVKKLRSHNIDLSHLLSVETTMKILVMPQKFRQSHIRCSKTHF